MATSPWPSPPRSWFRRSSSRSNPEPPDDRPLRETWQRCFGQPPPGAGISCAGSLAWHRAAICFQKTALRSAQLGFAHAGYTSIMSGIRFCLVIPGSNPGASGSQSPRIRSLPVTFEKNPLSAAFFAGTRAGEAGGRMQQGPYATIFSVRHFRGPVCRGSCCYWKPKTRF
jgi:hypothetical protein